MPDDPDMPGDPDVPVPDDGQAPEKTTVTCSGGIAIPPIGVRVE